MIHRTTFALDKSSALRLKRLAARWRVSQAEVVRRSLEKAEQEADSQKPDAVGMLRRLHEKGAGLDRDKADAYLAEGTVEAAKLIALPRPASPLVTALISNHL